MPDLFIRPMDPTELKVFYHRIKQDFPPEEYAPYDILYRHVKEGIQEGMVFCEGINDLAYSICVVNSINRYVLISLLAVFPEYRGKGIGSAFLKALNEKYKYNQAIIVEVERPEFSEAVKEQKLRQRRIQFYQKAGFYLIPEIDYTIWDVPMHLMALPIMASKDIINCNIRRVMYQIYYPLLGKPYIHKMSFHV